MFYFYKLALPFFLILTLLVLPTSLSQAKSDDGAYSLGAFNEPDGERYGIEISGLGKGDYMGGRISLTLYSGGNNIKTVYESNGFIKDDNSMYIYDKNKVAKTYESSERYAGISGFGFVHLGQTITPYLGLVFLLGKRNIVQLKRNSLMTAPRALQRQYIPSLVLNSTSIFYK